MKNHILTLLSIGASLGVTAFATAQDASKSPKPPKPPKPPKTHQLSFAQADLDKNGGLTVFEFATTQGPGTPLVEIRRRFLPIDVAGAFTVVLDPITNLPAVDPVTGLPIQGDPIPDGLVSLAELQAYQALAEKPKSDLSRFDLADFDGDGVLDPVEFGYLVSQKVKVANTLRKFAKLDLDDSGTLTLAEFIKPQPY